MDEWSVVYMHDVGMYVSTAALIWFEICGIVDPDKKNRFFQANSKKNIFFQAISQNLDLAIYSNFWANYSISLQKSPLLDMLPVHDRI